MQKRIYIYTCKTESLCFTPETNTTLLINYTSIKKFLKSNDKKWILTNKVREHLYQVPLSEDDDDDDK